MSSDFYSGFVSIVGRPNVGKSTLMNCLVGEKIAITSNKPQTTRNTIQSIMNGPKYQVVFIDTPGIHVPKHKLGEFMVKSATNSLNEVDVVLFVIEPTPRVLNADKIVIERLANVNTQVFLIINKIDTIDKQQLLTTIDVYSKFHSFAEIIPICAVTGENTDLLIDKIVGLLPVGPKFFPDDMITDQPERTLVSEIIREKALLSMEEEIPHGIAVEIMSMQKRESKDIVDIEANIYCEKDSHKGMIIGKGGNMLKKIGSLARIDIENLLGSKIFLTIWVKVKKDWRDNNFLIKSFGYKDI